MNIFYPNRNSPRTFPIISIRIIYIFIFKYFPKPCGKTQHIFQSDIVQSCIRVLLLYVLLGGWIVCRCVCVLIKVPLYSARMECVFSTIECFLSLSLNYCLCINIYFSLYHQYAFFVCILHWFGHLKAAATTVANFGY